MSRTTRWLVILAVLALSVVIITACAQPTPEVQVIKETVVVQQTVEVEKVVTKEVEKVVEVPSTNVVHLVARCKASPPYENGRCDNLVAALGAANQTLAAAGDDRRIELEAIQDDADWGDYKTEFELASDAGQAPDIIVSGHEHIGDWATAGYLTDITDMIGDYPEFSDVIDSLWEATKLDGRIWGVPQDAEARPMYFSKILLKQLGWTDEEIASLPDRVASGEFTWDDMFDTAQEAVEKGIVGEGDGWWHRPSNGPDFLYYYYGAGGEITQEGTDALVFDTEAARKVYNRLYDASQVRKIIRPNKLDGDWDFHKQYTSTFDKVMFVYEGTWRWASWATNYLQDQGGEDYLWQNVGFSAIPAQPDGTGKPITLTHPLLYMVSSQSKAPDLALLLISKATVKELNTSYAVASGHLGVLKSQSDYPPYTSAKFLSATLPLLQYTTFLPNSPYWSQWSEAYYLGLQAAESGDLAPDEAVDLVVEQLQNNLGDHVIIK